jgi:DNA-binding response OmpR family regulator
MNNQDQHGLLIVPHPVTRRLVGGAIESAVGCRLDDTGSLTEAIEWLATRVYSFVILDWSCEVERKYAKMQTLIDFCTDHGSHTIVLTRAACPSDQAEANVFGLTNCLEKPFNTAELLSAMNCNLSPVKLAA